MINRIGPHKMRVLFTPDERKFLDDMAKVSRIREPVRGTAVGRGPSAQAIARLEKKLQDLPIIGSVIDFVDFDTQGRLVMKATPERIPSEASQIERIAGGRVAPAVAPLAVEDEQ